MVPEGCFRQLNQVKLPQLGFRKVSISKGQEDGIGESDEKRFHARPSMWALGQHRHIAAENGRRSCHLQVARRLQWCSVITAHLLTRHTSLM